VAASDVDQGEEHAEQGGEADGEGDWSHPAGAPPRRQAQEEAHDRGREAHLQPAQGKEAVASIFHSSCMFVVILAK
jgi:hypothetical protein